MTIYTLGADLGGTKTHVMIADGDGHLVSFGEGGAGNHESVGYDGFKKTLHEAVNKALKKAGLSPTQISGAGFGIAGYDWPYQKQPIMAVIDTLNLSCPIELVNDAELGILSGSPRGWGIAVVSGTGCNCCGWDESRTLVGRVTGGGLEFGEFAGASELLFMVLRALAYEWTGRGPATALSKVFIERYGTKDLADLLQGFMTREVDLNPADVRLVFQVAAGGDPVALELIRWAGRELGEMANVVIRQLHFEQINFDLVQIGSMFDGSPLLDEEMRKVVLPFAPHANFIRTTAPPVIGAVLLALESAGVQLTPQIRANLEQTIAV